MNDPNRKEYSYSEKPNSSDTISRRKAFEYFVTLWECIGTIMDRDEWEDVCMTTVNEIPSAQPGIIHCKDCIYYRWEIDMCDEPYSTAHNFVHEYDYCSRAERRTDEQTD